MRAIAFTDMITVQKTFCVELLFKYIVELALTLFILAQRGAKRYRLFLEPSRKIEQFPLVSDETC